jgi:Tfp pilus assembly protein PilV
MLMTQPMRRCNGFSMLEAMAALMVLNMLCLGLMAWQLQAMQAQRDALSMQQAVAMAQDLWQRMQVHPGARPLFTNWD